ncbi:MAG TPA: hypothetical protein VGS27_01030, partial [Candidatus Sulfotelmatobacter sp.]|nr:hypothetical protein [Candidatus Sulfotelmatobacter sp.]
GVVQPRHADPATRKKERDDMIAQYFGYPNAEAHAAALAAKKAETKRVDQPPTPANQNANVNTAPVITPTPANVGADAPVRPGPAKPVREAANRPHATQTPSKKPSANVKQTPAEPTRATAG